MDSREKFKFSLHIIIPVVICIIPGYILYPQYIFKPYISTFQIITTAFIGSVFLASLKITGIKNSIGFFLIFAVLNSMLLTKPVESGYVLRDLFHYAALLISVYFFFRIFYRKSAPALYPVYIALIFAASYFVFISILALLKSYNMNKPANYYLETVLFPVLIDTMIGFCIGVGTFLADTYLPLKKKITEEINEDNDKEKTGAE